MFTKRECVTVIDAVFDLILREGELTGRERDELRGIVRQYLNNKDENYLLGLVRQIEDIVDGSDPDLWDSDRSRPKS